MGFANEVTSEMTALKLRLNHFADLVYDFAHRRLVERSPVDTANFRGNWRIAIEQIDGSRNEYPDSGVAAGAAKGARSPRLPAEADYAAAALSDAKFGDTVHFSNSSRHAEFVEAGRSKEHAPAGVVAPVRQEIESKINLLYIETFKTSARPRNAAGQFIRG